MKNKKKCIICKKNTSIIISNKIREGHQKVFFCKNCNFAFLGDKNLKCLSYLYNKITNYENFSKKRLESLKRNKTLLKIKSIKKIINTYTKLKIKLNSTFQEYSIENFFHWQFFSSPEKNLLSVSHDLHTDDLDNLFKSYCEKNNIGSSIILKASK